MWRGKKIANHGLNLLGTVLELEISKIKGGREEWSAVGKLSGWRAVESRNKSLNTPQPYCCSFFFIPPPRSISPLHPLIPRFVYLCFFFSISLLPLFLSIYLSISFLSTWISGKRILINFSDHQSQSSFSFFSFWRIKKREKVGNENFACFRKYWPQKLIS